MTGLPKLAAPARRALARVGLDTLEAVARHGRAQVAALHGMGPTALNTLDAALSKDGLSWRSR